MARAYVLADVLLLEELEQLELAERAQAEHCRIRDDGCGRSGLEWSNGAIWCVSWSRLSS